MLGTIFTPEPFATGADPETIEAGLRLALTRMGVAAAAPLLAGYLVYSILAGRFFEAVIYGLCLVVATVGLFFVTRFERLGRFREVLAAYRATSVVFFALWGLTHISLVGVDGLIEYSPWMLLMPVLAVMLMKGRDVAPLLGCYAAVIGWQLLSPAVPRSFTTQAGAFFPQLCSSDCWWSWSSSFLPGSIARPATCSSGSARRWRYPRPRPARPASHC